MRTIISKLRQAEAIFYSEEQKAMLVVIHREEVSTSKGKKKK